MSMICDFAFPVSLDQVENGTFTVTYGKQVRSGLNYDQAAKELGYCIMHSMANESLIVNAEDE